MFIKDHFSQTLCQMCHGKHGIWLCKQFKKLKVSQKWNFFRHLKLSFLAWGQDTWERHEEGVDLAALTIVPRRITNYCTLKIEL